MPAPTVLLVEDDPIVLLSARAQTRDLKVGMEAGADTKPFEPLDLVERVNARLSR